MRRQRLFHFDSSRSRQRKTHGTYSRRLAYEALEDRRLLAVNAVFAANEWTVTLDAADDKAIIRLDPADNTKLQVYDGAAMAVRDTQAKTDVKRVEVNGNSDAGQKVTIDESLNLDNGLEIKSSIEEAVINSDVTGVLAGNDILLSAGRTELGASLSTNGGGISLDASTALILLDNTTLSGSSITFNSTVDGDGNGPWDLTVNTTGGGTTAFREAVGATNPLGNLTTDADGQTTIGGAINTVADQTYNDMVELSADLVLATDKDGVPGTNAGDVVFDGGINGGFRLIVDARADGGGKGGQITLVSHVGDTAPLSALVFQTSAMILLPGPVELYTDGDVEFHASTLGLMPVPFGGSLSIDTESGNDSDGGDLDLDVGLVVDISGAGQLGLIQIDTQGGPADTAGTISLPPGFHPIGEAIGSVVYEDSLPTARILVKKEALDAALADFGDAPASYGTTLADDGARHLVIGNSLYFGTKRDNEPDGPAAGTGAEDNDPPGAADEDGVTFTSDLDPGQNATVNVTLSEAGLLDAWIDLNRDGDFTDATEQIFASLALTPGTTPLSFRVPNTAVAGATYTRFRVSSAGGLDPTGLAVDGEVEDYAVTIAPAVLTLDFGDAPTSAQSGFGNSYPTTAADNGPRHTVGGPTLGNAWDAEADGQPNASATGDDLADTDDEDGVTIPTLIPGQNATLQVSAPAGGMLDAWIDYNRDGDFTVLGEQVATSEILAVGSNPLNFVVPGTASVGTSYARFRVSTAGGLTPTGGATDGEVEDHQVTIAAAPMTLFSEDFNNPPVDSRLVTQSGTFNLAGSAYFGARAATYGNAIATIESITLPSNFRVDATVNMSSGNGSTLWSNGLIIFDYVDANNFKYAGAFEIIDRYVIGQVSNGQKVDLKEAAMTIVAGTNIDLSLEIRGTVATLSANGSQVVTHTFGSTLNTRPVGIGTLNANTTFDDLVVVSI